MGGQQGEDTGDQSELTWARGLMTRLARADSSLGQMFLVRKASMAARLNSTVQFSTVKHSTVPEHLRPGQQDQLGGAVSRVPGGQGGAQLVPDGGVDHLQPVTLGFIRSISL